MNAVGRLLAILCFGATLAFAPPATALPVGYKIALEDAQGQPVFTGEMLIDDMRLIPDTFTAFGDLLFYSLSITTDERTYTLVNAENPNTEGVVTDANGMVSAFADSGGGLIATLVSLGTPNIFLAFAPNGWAEFSFVPPQEFASGPTVTFTLVPEPATLVLLGFGAVGLVAIRRRPRAA